MTFDTFCGLVTDSTFDGGVLKHKFRISFFFLILLMSELSKTVYAENNIQAAYDTLVINGQNEVIVSLDYTHSKYEPLRDIVLIDNEDPYDADMILLRGTSIKTYSRSDGNVHYELVNAIDIKEAEALLNVMQDEIDQNLSSNASQKQILRQIQKYLARTYSYDYDSVYADGEKENFVVAYYSDRQIVCSQYAALVYLLCNRYGIDCKAYYGIRHVFNAIRFDGEQDYTLYDFTGIKSILTPKLSYLQFLFSSKYHLDPDNEYDMVVKKAINDRIDVHISWTIVETLVILNILTLILVTILCIRLIKHRIYAKKHPARFRNVGRR
jgi:hypothetical protein